jgi:Zn-dependent peptidase ImmA (M78 family)
MSATTRDAATGAGVLATLIARWLDARLHLPAVDVPTYARQVDSTTAAERVRSEWDMGYAKIRNAVHLLEAHGVHVFSLPEHLVDVDAFSFWFDRQPYVVLNTRKTAERIRFDAMHELGHLVMHADYDMPDTREREHHANRFAAAMLMPADDVLASRLRNAGVERVLEARHRWGVSAMALTHRIHELALTSDWVYTSTCRRLSQLGYRSSEPGGTDSKETSQVLEKSLKVLRDRGVTQIDIARELYLQPSRVRELLFGLTLTPLQGDAQPTSTRPPELTLFRGGG